MRQAVVGALLRWAVMVLLTLVVLEVRGRLGLMAQHMRVAAEELFYKAQTRLARQVEQVAVGRVVAMALIMGYLAQQAPQGQ